MCASSSGGGFAGERCGGICRAMLAVGGGTVGVGFIFGCTWIGSAENLFWVGMGAGPFESIVQALTVFLGIWKHLSARDL